MRVAAVAAFLRALGVNAAPPIASDTFLRDARKRFKELAPDHDVSGGYLHEFMHIWQCAHN